MALSFTSKNSLAVMVVLLPILSWRCLIAYSHTAKLSRRTPVIFTRLLTFTRWAESDSMNLASLRPSANSSKLSMGGSFSVASFTETKPRAAILASASCVFPFELCKSSH